MKRRSDIEFTIKNRILDLIAKLFSLKQLWAGIVTFIFLVTDKVDSFAWLAFIAGVLGINAIEKGMHVWNSSKQNNQTKETVGTEPDA